MATGNVDEVVALDAELGAVDPALLNSNALLAAVLGGSNDCIKILDLDGHLLFMSKGGQRVMEVLDFGALRGCPWPDFWTDQDNITAKAAVEKARQGHAAEFEGCANTAQGNPRYWHVQVMPILNDQGQPQQLLSISRDITDRKKAELKAEVIRSELHHRIKNTLALVSAIASQTLRGADIADRRAMFSKRLSALAKAQDMLDATAWTQATVKDVVCTALEVHQTGDRRFNLSGPSVALPPKLALSLAMAIHELATNAVKYGALSTDDGHVEITWNIENDRVRAGFTFQWIEIGGPLVFRPAQTGFGTKLITNVLAGDFGGTVDLDYQASGLYCRLIAPADNLA